MGEIPEAVDSFWKTVCPLKCRCKDYKYIGNPRAWVKTDVTATVLYASYAIRMCYMLAQSYDGSTAEKKEDL